MRGGGLFFIAMGCAMLGTYGVVVNRVPWDFSRLLGVYVAVFATVSVLFGRFAYFPLRSGLDSGGINSASGPSRPLHASVGFPTRALSAETPLAAWAALAVSIA